ncbi:MAG: hypothetical protein AM326_03030 [Candidatus Thorarchaeota archaeon SMTZ-45]|nr:MAG: hypothetical protein AM326_03030 [Candidatus Thorarchaeota archaeon SMTZ-45]
MIVFDMHRGDDKLYELIVTDKNTGNAVDITGCMLTMTWKENKKDSGYYLQKTNGSGITLTDPTNGKAEIAIDKTDTSGLDKYKEYFFDVYILKTTGKGETLLEGKFKVHEDVTT